MSSNARYFRIFFLHKFRVRILFMYRSADGYMHENIEFLSLEAQNGSLKHTTGKKLNIGVFYEKDWISLDPDTEHNEPIIDQNADSH